MTMRLGKQAASQRAAPANGRVQTPRKVTYPESDGKPMAETWMHVRVLVRLLTLLHILFRERGDVQVGGNMMLYWVEGQPRHRVSPDAFVVLGVTPQLNPRTWKTWEDGTPSAIFEVTSKETRKNDLGKKRDLYEALGVQEYYLFDPLGEYLNPRLQGYRLVDSRYVPMGHDEGGGIHSALLGARFLPGDQQLRVFSLPSGEELLDVWDTPAVPESQLREQVARTAAAEARVAELERLLRERDGS